ncbi:unnamed protein product [Urochloa humidicola]
MHLGDVGRALHQRRTSARRTSVARPRESGLPGFRRRPARAPAATRSRLRSSRRAGPRSVRRAPWPGSDAHHALVQMRPPLRAGSGRRWMAPHLRPPRRISVAPPVDTDKKRKGNDERRQGVEEGDEKGRG